MAGTTPRQVGPPGDLLLAGAFAAVSQTEIWVFSIDADFAVWVRVAASLFTLAASGALALRRTRPVLSFWANTIAVVATIAVGFPSDYYQWTSLVATYSIAVHGTGRTAWIALPAQLGGVLFYFVRFRDEGDMRLGGSVAGLWVVGWLIGRVYGARLEHDRLRRERDVARRLADANSEQLAHEEERNRIARDLHDIIGHTVNVMVVFAGAGRRAVDHDVGTVRQAFDTIEQTGRTALSELDRVLAVLRRDQTDRAPPAPRGLDDLRDLATTFTDTGLRVDVAVSGDAGAVPASVGLAAYRIVQEALTNTLKHADARSASVQAGVTGRRLDLRVSDDGQGDPSALHPGRGIIGMRERAALHGGSVGLDRDGDRGLVVTATLTWEGDP